MQKHGAKPTVYKDPTKEGCEFLGWYIAGTLNKFDFNDPVTSDLQLVAQWRVKSYTVTLDTNGGEPLDDLAIDHGEQIAQLMATRTGYTLTGWTDADGNAVKFPITVTSDLALTAQWKLDAPDVTITADKSDKDAHTGDTVILTANPSHALGGATYTYQWYKGRKKIEGATEKTLEVTKDGEYTVDVAAHDGKNESAAATSNSITLAFEKHDVMLAFAHGEVERHANEIGGTFTHGLTIQVRALGAVVYTSDNEDVATVDPATGEVAIKGVVEAVITAKIAETDTHEAAEASYKLTVTDHDSGTWQTVKAPTCTEVGSEQRVCEVCGEVLETREIAAKGHEDGEWVVTKQVTCTEPGEKELHCATCGEVIKTEAIPATGHAATHVSAQDATCTEQGVIEHWACGTCGKLFADEACTVEMSQADTVAPALGHKLEAVAEVPATCETPGVRAHYACATCGELFLDAEGEQPADEDALAIPALGHKLEQVVAVAPTIDKEGVEAHYRCTVCGELYQDAEGTKKVEHADDLVVKKLEAVTVTFDDCIDPKDDQVSVRLEKGGVISPDDIPADPSYEGYTFLDWFLSDEATQIWGDQFDPEAPVTHDVLVGAKWQKNDGSDGGATQKPSDKPSTPAKKPSSKPDDAGKETLVQTGDSAFAQVAAAFTAGVAALFTGLGFHRRRED
ncbi:MAG: InlB B-repeat-containing protein [Collinsella stercoris]|nr:InlB B-repeat-containing protein [Collinsella stercoris]